MWRNWQTRMIQVHVGNHAGSSPVIRTNKKKAVQNSTAFFLPFRIAERLEPAVQPPGRRAAPRRWPPPFCHLRDISPKINGRVYPFRQLCCISPVKRGNLPAGSTKTGGFLLFLQQKTAFFELKKPLYGFSSTIFRQNKILRIDCLLSLGIIKRLIKGQCCPCDSTSLLHL